MVAGPLVAGAVVLDGPVLIGRGAACDLRLDHGSVAPAHVLIEPEADGWVASALAPGTVTTIDGARLAGPVRIGPGAVLGVGAVDLQLVDPEPPAPVAPPAQPIHRAAPSPGPGTPEPGPPPEAPAPIPAPRPPGALSLGLPVAVGAILAVIVHPTAGLITAATPLLSVGSHLDARRRWRRDQRRQEAEHRTETEDHRRAAAAHGRAVAAARRGHHPTPADALRRARRGQGLWPVRATDPSADLVAVGWADDELRAPVTVRLDTGRHLGVAGPPLWADAVARALVVQISCRLGPNDRRVEVNSGDRWRFTRWLPHRDGRGAPLYFDPGPHDGRDDGAAIETADRLDALTDRCRAVLAWSPDGARLTDADAEAAGRAVPVRPFLATEDHAERYARAVARWHDPGPEGTGLADRVSLVTLLAGDGPAGDGRRALAVPLGVGARGVHHVDLVADGPHALVAGTTGAGKSELLRTWIAGLAHRYPPTAVAFVLVDYKGGSAFDACARLPHVTGVVTNLDAGLGERLLVGLRAEVRDREAALRRAGVGDLVDLAAGPPRLVVVVDEFATLAAELPEFLGALVDVARRGRSLGLHLVLATQRPAGAVNDDIRANTALRICLRTLDGADSQDVIGGPQAASLPAGRPGRAWIRAGDEPRLAQVATTGEPITAAGPQVRVRRVDAPWPVEVDRGPTELEHLVTGTREARGAMPGAVPVWRPPLPDQLVLAAGGDAEVVLGLEDRPAERTQPHLTWAPTGGHLVVVGGRGRGRTTALRTALLSLAWARPPDALHVYVVDRGTGLADLVDLPHVGGLVPAHDRPSVRRLVGRIAASIASRPPSDSGPLTVLAIDGYDALAAGIDDLDGIRLMEGLDRLARDGPGRGLALAVTSTRPALLPPTLLSTAATLLALGLDDPSDYGLLGLRTPGRPEPPGRARSPSGHEVQVALIDATVSRVATRHGPATPGSGPPSVAPLPHRVSARTIRATDGTVALGLRDRDLGPARIDLRPDAPFVVAGPPRSGRSTTLALLLAQAPDRPRTVHRSGGDPADLTRAVRAWLNRPSPHLFVVDDAELVADPDGDLRALVTRRHPDALVVVSIRADAWRSGYGSWCAELRPGVSGLALSPDPVHDADCWAVPLPALDPAPPAGRGVLVGDGTAEVVQIAVIDD